MAEKTAAERVALARHPQRPNITDYIDGLFTDFFEQRGDRACREDPAILGGVALFHGRPVTVIGTRKGKTLEENLRCNFGMPGPEGYRKALRLMKQAEKIRRPIFTFIDSAGAYPAVKEECYIEIVSYGGDTTGYQIPFNVHYTGVKSKGTFNPATNTFTAE